ncbi:MAG: lysophospholipid acyltransferase family protein [Chloroflexia bacterium]
MGPTKDVAREIRLPRGDLGPAGRQLRAFRALLRGVFQVFFRVRVRGLAGVPPGPIIICSNHLGWADTFLLLLFFPIEPRIYLLGNENVRDLTWFRTWIINTLKILIPVDYGRPAQAVRVSLEVLRRSGSLVAFPEGTVEGTAEGRLLPLQDGAAYLSQAAGVPLVPVGLTGTKQLWLRRTLTMRIGPAVYPAEFMGDRRERAREQTTKLSAEMRALLPGDYERPRYKPLRRWLTNLFA